MITLRASKAPLAFRCAGSLQPPKVAIDETSEPARLGTAAHVALRPRAEGGGVAWDALADMADAHEVDGDELRMLCAMATKLWPQLAPSFPGAQTEVEMRAGVGDSLTLTGHADLLSMVDHPDGRAVHGGDWKTGRKDSDYSQQMRCYCAIALLSDSALVHATWTLIWLRSGEVESYTMARADLAQWLADTELALWNWDGTYRPGPWCDWCPRAHECEARTAMVRRDIAAFLGSTIMADAMVPGAMVSMAGRARMVKKAAEAVLDLIKAHVDAHGDIVGADGVTLTITETPQRKLDVGRAWPVLEAAGFGDDDFVSTLTMSVGKIEKRIAQRAGKGNGAAAVRELERQLEAAGAVIMGTKRTLEEVRR
jgi:hypothetical protein